MGCGVVFDRLQMARQGECGALQCRLARESELARLEVDNGTDGHAMAITEEQKAVWGGGIFGPDRLQSKPPGGRAGRLPFPVERELLSVQRLQNSARKTAGKSAVAPDQPEAPEYRKGGEDG